MRTRRIHPLFPTLLLAVSFPFAAAALPAAAAVPKSTNPAPAAPADVAAPPADAQVTASGLASKVLKAGPGTRPPRRDSIVRAHYAGWTRDGKLFDSSSSRGAPASFGLSAVTPGGTGGLQLMTVGEPRRFWIPKGLAYRGAPGKPEGM